MDRISYLVNRVDGSQQLIEGDPSDLRRFQELTAQGYTGRRLLDELITDDWGAPPAYVIISTHPDGGAPASISIRYA
jgi:hypothetical protein